MTATEYRNAIVALGLSHAEAARLWGVTRRHEFRLASGKTPVPRPIVVLLRLVAAGRIRVVDIARA